MASYRTLLSRSSRIVFVQMCILLYYWATKMMMMKLYPQHGDRICDVTSPCVFYTQSAPNPLVNPFILSQRLKLNKSWNAGRENQDVKSACACNRRSYWQMLFTLRIGPGRRFLLINPSWKSRGRAEFGLDSRNVAEHKEQRIRRKTHRQRHEFAFIDITFLSAYA